MTREPFLLLMPSYNQAHYIVEAVESVLQQDDGNWELWIVDNSTDSTPKAMARFTDPRVRFHHIPSRMDPGTCLNWMLERCKGRDFSYIHTDNNLDPSFVRKMRAALAEHPLGLAYCDVRVIDENGQFKEEHCRGEFDFPRLLSIDTLGVPFAATTELARRVGGFSQNDFADDVRFCVTAFGIADYRYVAEPLVDYRLHPQSRTSEAGAVINVRRILCNLMLKLAPSFEQRGLHPIATLEQEIAAGFGRLDRFMENVWTSKLAATVRPWWSGPFRAEYLFFAGVSRMPGFSRKYGQPSRQGWIRNQDRKIVVMPWTKRRAIDHLREFDSDWARILRQPAQLLPTWACLKMGTCPAQPITLAVDSVDLPTLWAARQLEMLMEWKPAVTPSAAARAPSWLDWPVTDQFDYAVTFAEQPAIRPRETFVASGALQSRKI